MSAVVSSAEYCPLIGKSTLTDANLLQICGTQGHTLAAALARSAVDQAPPAASIRSKTRPPGPGDGQNARRAHAGSGRGRTPFCHIVVHSLQMGVPGKGE